MATTDLPNLRHLNIALHINENYGFSAASRTVNLSPSAITQAMRGLEKTIGAKLFDRSSSGAFPNDAGKLYLDRIKRAFDVLDKAEHTLDLNSPNHTIRSRITIGQLRAFIMVCQCGSYSLASRRLGLSQPSVYKSARGIEIEFDQKLFLPSSTGVDPTNKAREFARFASIALSEIERAQEDVDEFQGRMSGRLAIGTLPLVRPAIVPSAVYKLLEQHPDAKVGIYGGIYKEMIDTLRHGELDLVLAPYRDPAPARDIQQTIITNSIARIVAKKNHPLGNEKKVSLDRLKSFGFIVQRLGSHSRNALDYLFADHPDQNNLRILECGAISTVRSILMNSDWLSILSEHQVEYEISNGDLVYVDVDMGFPATQIAIVTRQAWHPTKVQDAFIRILKTENYPYN